MSIPFIKVSIGHYKREQIIIISGQRYKGNFICNGDELNIRECRPSFHPVTTCDTGDLVVHCDRG